MSLEDKIKIVEALAKCDLKISQFIIEYNGNTYIGDQEEKNTKVSENSSESVKDDIIGYVDRLKPMVKVEYQERYEAIWQGILNLSEVRQHVYKKGKQQDTTFNRNLVAQIIHLLIDKIYLPATRPAQMAECLEPEKGVEHPVRKKLGESPDKIIKKSVENYLIENL